MDAATPVDPDGVLAGGGTGGETVALRGGEPDAGGATGGAAGWEFGLPLL